MPRRPSNPQRYSAPALEKGLDILELLAGCAEGLSQSEIARRLGRSPSEIFRMLACLEQREYLRRGDPDDRYRLSSKLFQLAHIHPPTQRLLEAALPEMRSLAQATRQSTHLAVRHHDQAIVLGQVDSPGLIGFAVRVGSQQGLADCCSGRMLLAFQADETRDRWLEAAGVDAESERRSEILADLAATRVRGYREQPSRITQGITDISVPVFDHSGGAIAALTIPCLTYHGQELGHEEIRSLQLEAAARIGSLLGNEAGTEGEKEGS